MKQAVFHGQEMWIGIADVASGTIRETHTLEEAKRADFHTCFYFSEESEKKHENKDGIFFWVQDGKVELEYNDLSPYEKTLLETQIKAQVIILDQDESVLRKTMLSERQENNNRDGNRMQIQILYSCNEWKEHSSMKIVCATTNPEVLYALIGESIKAGDMEYGCEDKEKGWELFQQDYGKQQIRLELLQYGFVESMPNLSISDKTSIRNYSEVYLVYTALHNQRAEEILRPLHLDRQCLIYSMADAIVDIMGVPKAEGNVDAIIMRMPDRNSGASLNCKDLYADYVKSNSFEKTMIRCLQSLIPYLKRDDEIDIQKIMNWEEVKEIIVPELVCTRRAGENLEDLIYRNVEGTDLAIIYRVKQQVANIVGSIKVSKQMMETWGVDENRIHEFAFHNMNQLSTLQIVELNSDFAMPEETFSELPEKMNKYSSYVFTNKEAFYGAATIMEEGMLHSIAERLQEGFYLLPMDVDNIVVYPEGMMKNLESIHSMVLIHNIQCLEPENYLSDQVYYYSKEKGELSMSTNPENTQDVIIKILQQAMECSPGKKEDYGEER